MPSPILFYDPLCQQPYDTRTLRERAMGGTEATLVRVADALDAWVMQHNRTEDWQRYRSPQTLPGITHIILMRAAGALCELRQQYPHASFYLWLHDRLRPGGRRARALIADLRRAGSPALTAICVSNWQRADVEATLRGARLAGAVRCLTLYNPIDETLRADNTAVDENKLVFFSSPNKGLAFSLDAFASLRRQLPRLRLVVGNPGYRSARQPELPGVEFLGPQPQARIHDEVRGALCTFFPNFVIPETFGLVFAESHALGTPVLTYACGAAPEIVQDPQQLIALPAAARVYEGFAGLLSPAARRVPARLAAALGLFDVYAERVHAWRAGARPQVRADPRFLLSRISAQWRSLLAD
jgi:glycosyltransferase involved in cell wall biosynthesis